MKVLVIGSGGREHALVEKIRQSSKVEKVYCAPGNAGIGLVAECVPINGEDFARLADLVQKEGIGLIVVGPEIPLANGIVDYFNERGIAIFGPNKKAAQLEASKAFAKDFMRTHGVPTAAYKTFSDYNSAAAYIDKFKEPLSLVVKADGLAAGKGVIICPSKSSAKLAAEQIMKGKLFGTSGKKVVVEKFLKGEEASLQLFLDGEHYSLMVASQDHKRVLDGDQGLNTGGMGAYAPTGLVSASLLKKIEKQVVAPIIKGLKKEGIDYKGVLYIGLMISNDIPYVLEFNCRFGDPETQVVLPLLKSDLVEIIENINAKTLDKIKIEWYNKSAVCVVLTSRGYPGEYEKGKTVQGLSELAKLPDILVFHAGTSWGDKDSIVTSGGRVIGITGVAGTIAAAVAKAYNAVASVRFDGMHFRRDIGFRELARTQTANKKII